MQEWSSCKIDTSIQSQNMQLSKNFEQDHTFRFIKDIYQDCHCRQIEEKIFIASSSKKTFTFVYFDD